MNKIREWLNSLELEIIIIFIVLVIILIITIYTLIKNHKIYAAIAKKTLSAKEDLVLENNVNHARVVTTNIGYTNNIIKELGFIYKKTKLPIKTEEFNLSARNSEVTIIEIDELRSFILDETNKVKMFYFYVVDSVNRTTKTKMKLSFKFIKKTIKNETDEEERIKRESKKELKKQNKVERYETGNYNFGDRVSLILAAIFSPLSKLFKFIAKKINKSLRKREIKKEVKNQLLKEQREILKAEELKQEDELRYKVSVKYSDKLAKKNAKNTGKVINDEDEELVTEFDKTSELVINETDETTPNLDENEQKKREDELENSQENDNSNAQNASDDSDEINEESLKDEKGDE